MTDVETEACPKWLNRRISVTQWTFQLWPLPPKPTFFPFALYLWPWPRTRERHDERRERWHTWIRDRPVLVPCPVLIRGANLPLKDRTCNPEVIFWYLTKTVLKLSMHINDSEAAKDSESWTPEWAMHGRRREEKTMQVSRLLIPISFQPGSSLEASLGNS